MKQADVIILAGQSNAVGVGHTEYLPRHFSEEKIREYTEGYARIPINYHSHDKRSGGFVPVTVGCTELSKQTLGPEVGMAEVLSSARPERDIFIVKCAVGGTSLWRDWISPRSGDPYDPTADADQVEDAVWCINNGLPLRGGWCYNQLVKLARESLACLEAQGYTPRIRGFCWMQGEADAVTDELVAAYGVRYDNMLADLTEALAPYMEGCVFVDAGISEIWPKYKELNAVKRAYAEAREDGCYISTIDSGLTTRNEPEGEPDIYHYDVASTVRLGQLFAEALLDNL